MVVPALGVNNYRGAFRIRIILDLERLLSFEEEEMPSLSNYIHRVGHHPVSSSILAALAHAGATAPHTGEPFSEALLCGIAGGVMVGYFYFDYEGEEPQINIVTRNSFHDYGFEKITTRLRLGRELYQTTSQEKARRNLVELLEADEAPVVNADVYSLGYEESEFNGEMWAMQPILVSSYETGGVARVADRARVPLLLPSEQLDAARGRIKKERYRITTLEYTPLEEAELVDAVKAGIGDSLELYTEKPPAGSANNFGFKALERWSAALRKPTGKTSWHKLFPGGSRLFGALSTAYQYASLFWKDESETADRELYARFLDEASEIASLPGLKSAADAYRQAAAAWKGLAHILLPDGEPLLGEERRLLHERHRLFLERGTEAQPRRDEIARERRELRERSSDLLQDEARRAAFFSEVADAVDRVHDRGYAAYEALKSAL